MEPQELTLDTLCTYNIGLDKYIYHIVSIPKKNELIVHRFDMPNTHESFTRRKDGRYQPKGNKIGRGGYLTFGEAINYGDPSF